MPLREFPLNNLPCWECGRPALAFVPPIGVKHLTGWCRTGNAECPTVPRATKPQRARTPQRAWHQAA